MSSRFSECLIVKNTLFYLHNDSIYAIIVASIMIFFKS